MGEFSNLHYVPLKVPVEKNRRSQNFEKQVFKQVKKSVLDQFLESSISRRYHWISKLLVAT